ncbi:unnamed protein product [Toxocara canis]|uniref:WD domain, G-beta repeat-containing protein n=1 Tax=Toxocara canis TaxID=6265 RepID=A0A183V1M9_TOXCA|nr:unnamed protein product [Toxocara canis]
MEEGASRCVPGSASPELVCLIPWKNASQPEKITALALNSAYGILAIGMASGLALVDIVQYTLIYSWASSELYGSEATPSVLINQNSETSLPDRGASSHHSSNAVVTHAASFSIPRRVTSMDPCPLRRNHSDAADCRRMPLLSLSSIRNHCEEWVMENDTESPDSEVFVTILDDLSERTFDERANSAKTFEEVRDVDKTRTLREPKEGHEKRTVRQQHSSPAEILKRSWSSRDGISSTADMHELARMGSRGISKRGSSQSAKVEQLLETCIGCERIEEFGLDCLTSVENASSFFSIHFETCSSCPNAEHVSSSVLSALPADRREDKEKGGAHGARRSHSTRVSNLVRRLTDKGRGLARSISVQLSEKNDVSTARSGADSSRDLPAQYSPRNDTKEPPSPRRDSSSPDSSDKMCLPEAVTSLCFIHSCSKKNDMRPAPSLWLGTSTGACIAFNLLLPSDRLNSTVVVAPTGVL